jgi:hypothetical protein
MSKMLINPVSARFDFIQVSLFQQLAIIIVINKLLKSLVDNVLLTKRQIA